MVSDSTTFTRLRSSPTPQTSPQSLALRNAVNNTTAAWRRSTWDGEGHRVFTSTFKGGFLPCLYPLVMTNSLLWCYGKSPFIVDFPINNIVGDGNSSFLFFLCFSWLLDCFRATEQHGNSSTETFDSLQLGQFVCLQVQLLVFDMLIIRIILIIQFSRGKPWWFGHWNCHPGPCINAGPTGRWSPSSHPLGLIQNPSGRREIQTLARLEGVILTKVIGNILG